VTLTINDPRGQYVMTEAIALAIEALSRLPPLYRPESNINDLKEVLNDLSPSNIAVIQYQARRRVDILLGNTPPPTWRALRRVNCRVVTARGCLLPQASLNACLAARVDRYHRRYVPQEHQRVVSTGGTLASGRYGSQASAIALHCTRGVT
jgi:hypothetical protein